MRTILSRMSNPRALILIAARLLVTYLIPGCDGIASGWDLNVLLAGERWWRRFWKKNELITWSTLGPSTPAHESKVQRIDK